MTRTEYTHAFDLILYIKRNNYMFMEGTGNATKNNAANKITQRKRKPSRTETLSFNCKIELNNKYHCKLINFTLTAFTYFDLFL